MIHILNRSETAPGPRPTQNDPRGPSHSARPRGKAAKVLRTALREPLVHFILAGAVLYGLSTRFAGDGDRHLIRMGDAEEERIARNFANQYGTAPSEAQLKDLIGREIREEVLFREGKELELDKGDEIIRRRVAQKFEFLQLDRVAAREPADVELMEWFASHRGRYAEPERATFTHIYFSPDRGGPEAARRRAEAVLAALRESGTERAPGLGDRFPDQYDYAGVDRMAVARIFGESPLVDGLFAARTGRWAGPYHSGYGEHLVRIASRQAPVAVFSQVRDKVRADWLADFRQAGNDKAFAAIQARYRVVR
ncbi:MAG: hypothetical protein JWP91_3594 [Fibrobacteres bacterium]|nr:hypothetical protein [Fibrobacterota bacterium]